VTDFAGDEDLAALVLAAGEGRRLRPLTLLRPKPLCPVADTTLLDLACQRVGLVVAPSATAVNAHYLVGQISTHVAGRFHLSVEQPVALGTAGAVGALHGWLDRRDVLVANGDVCFGGSIDLAGFVEQWDRERPRLLVVEDARLADFEGRWRFAGVSLLPARLAAALPAEPAGLYEAVWRSAQVDLVRAGCQYVDCADPSSYLRANLMLSGAESVVGEGAVVEGEIERCVIWPGAAVHADERLVEVVRARDAEGRDLTVPAAQDDQLLPSSP
jgi:molybdopterin-guanine dinucleotide biosynthesis protein A